MHPAFTRHTNNHHSWDTMLHPNRVLPSIIQPFVPRHSWWFIPTIMNTLPWHWQLVFCVRVFWSRCCAFNPVCWMTWKVVVMILLPSRLRLLIINNNHHRRQQSWAISKNEQSNTLHFVYPLNCTLDTLLHWWHCISIHFWILHSVITLLIRWAWCLSLWPMSVW